MQPLGGVKRLHGLYGELLPIESNPLALFPINAPWDAVRAVVKEQRGELDLPVLRVGHKLAARLYAYIANFRAR